MVKAIADHSRTNVKENRRNARNLIESYFTRENNKAAKNLKPNVNRIQCAEGFAHFLEIVHELSLIRSLRRLLFSIQTRLLHFVNSTVTQV